LGLRIRVEVSGFGFRVCARYDEGLRSQISGRRLNTILEFKWARVGRDRGDRARELVLDVPEDCAPEVHCRRDSRERLAFRVSCRNTG
jgi:hypothetical protein